MKRCSRGFVLTKGVLLTGLFTSFFAWNKLMADEIAREGKTQYTIVQADQATEREKLAVRELTNFLGRATGASFPVVAESALSNEVQGIYVGWTKFAAKNGIDAAKLGEEEWIIRSAGKNLILTGGRPQGTLYAVYEFLENQVGCHWLDRNTDIIPSRPTLEFAKLNIQGKPVMWSRGIGMAYNQVMPTGDMKNRQSEFLTRNKNSQLGYTVIGSSGSAHTFFKYVNASNWFESHPEYFSLNAQGQRVPAKHGEGPGQLCLTHPDVRRIVLEQLRKFIAKDRAAAANGGYPPPRIYGISQNDVYNGHCQCTNCQAIAKREDSESGPLIDFINAIAADIEKDYPDILVQTMAYNLTEKPPKTLKPRRNVMIRWCDVYNVSDPVRPLNHPYNSKNYEEITGWGKIASHLAVWDYWISFGSYYFPTPWCMIQCIGPDMKLFADMHVEMFVAQSDAESLYAPLWDPTGVGCYEPGENFTDLKYWLGYKQMVNPYQPVDPLIQTFMEGYYGAAAPKMNEYLKYLEGRIDKEADFMMVCNAPNLKYLDLNFFVAAEKLFDEAEKAIKPGSLEALHVQRERLMVDGALLYLWPWLDRKLAANEKMPFDHETVILRHETNWRAQSKAFYSEKAQALREERIVKLAALFRDPQLPGQFGKLPSRDVADFNWLTLSKYTPGRQIFVADDDAAGGMAVAFMGDSEDAHKKPLTFVVTGGARVTLKPEEVPQDGKYHLFEIGRVNVKKGTAVRAHVSGKLGVNVDRLCVTNAADSAVNDWDAYISLKVKGPAYVKGSTETNGVWMDRVLLVKPPKGEKADAAELRRQEDEKKMAARRAAPPPQVKVRQSPKGAAGDPLKVDWDKTATGGEWCTILGYSSSRNVQARFAQDGEYFYVRLTEEVKPESLTNDPKIWKGDDWELFFAPKRGTKPYRQMGINPKGEHMEVAYGESSHKWESGVCSISETGANCWKVSMSFPLDRLLPGGVKPGQSVYVNIVRAFGSQGDTLAWSPNFENNFHSLERLGEIILE